MLSTSIVILSEAKDLSNSAAIPVTVYRCFALLSMTKEEDLNFFTRCEPFIRLICYFCNE